MQKELIFKVHQIKTGKKLRCKIIITTPTMSTKVKRVNKFFKKFNKTQHLSMRVELEEHQNSFLPRIKFNKKVLFIDN
jgi:hypothetical protein